jgi:chaperonin GroEL
MKDVKLSHLGSSKTVEASKTMTTIVGGKGDDTLVGERIDLLKSQFEQTDNMQACERIQERITRLASGIAIINVGGNTEIEMVEKKHRVEDALEAVKSAQQEGMVTGGGMALIVASKGVEIDATNPDQELGAKIILKAVEDPLKQMAKNAGNKPDVILDRAYTLKEGEGFDLSTGEVTDLMEKGIIDPVKVTRCALQNAVSAIGTLITTSHAVIDK